MFGKSSFTVWCRFMRVVYLFHESYSVHTEILITHVLIAAWELLMHNHYYYRGSILGAWIFTKLWLSLKLILDITTHICFVNKHILKGFF